MPIITLLQEPDGAFPAVARWVEALGRIEIGVEGGREIVARALTPESLVFEDRKSRTLAEAMAALEAGLARWFDEQGVETQ